MRRSSFVFLAGVAWGGAAAWAADATRPIDYTQRNEAFVPQPQVQSGKRTPGAEVVPQSRVTPPKVDKQPAAVGERRAAIDVTETRDKRVQEKNSRAPEKVEQPRSSYDQQRARISTAADTNRPPLVTKYQDSLTAASASNMARFPAVSGATNAKINRFVFRKNGGTPADAPVRGPVVPAAGGSPLTK